MKKSLAAALCAAMALSVTACSTDEPEDVPTEPSTSQSVSAEDHVTAEPEGSYVDYQTLEDAEHAVGFSWTIPESIADSTDREFRVVDGSVLDILYEQGETRTACIRKAPGTEDLSGDPTDYAQMEEVSVGDVMVSMKGANGLFSLAVWNDDTYTYSVSLDTGVSQEELSQLVQSLQETV